MNPFGSTKLIDVLEDHPKFLPGAKMKPETVAKKIVAEILDKGLAVSTFRDNYPDAYENLRQWYRADLEADVVRILSNQWKGLRQAAEVAKAYHDGYKDGRNKK